MTLWIQTALAAPAISACDAAGLQKTLADASPAGVPAAFQALAACNPSVAATSAAPQLVRMNAGEPALNAARVAIGIGASDAIRAWVTALQPDERSAAIAGFGTQCKDDPRVEGFLIENMEKLGPKFFEQRWYRGLTDCRTDKVRDLLKTALELAAAPGVQHHSTAMTALLEVYARNAGAEALPTLSALATSLKDMEAVSNVVGAFADAAAVGSATGTNVNDAAKAIDELNKIATQLPPKSLDQARSTLLALGAEPVADALAGVRWADRKKEGLYAYPVTAVEDVTCKNGKRNVTLHLGILSEKGLLWPDTLQTLIGDKLAAAWKLDGAARCKGNGTITYAISPEPPADDAARQSWFELQTKSFADAAAGAAKTTEVKHPPVAM